MMKKILLAIALALVSTTAAYAQAPIQARVIATCGTASYTAGNNAPATQDTTGTLCTPSGGGGGSSNATIVAPLGSKVSASSVSVVVASDQGTIPVTQSGTFTVQSGNTSGCTSNIAVSQTTSTDLHTMSTFGYICSIILIIADAESISITEGTGTLCATGASALIGSTTVGNGMSLIANEGFTAVNTSPFIKMNASGDHICLLQSGSGRLAGIITYSDH